MGKNVKLFLYGKKFLNEEKLTKEISKFSKPKIKLYNLFFFFIVLFLILFFFFVIS